jgi:hypothetical protein
VVVADLENAGKYGCGGREMKVPYPKVSSKRREFKQEIYADSIGIAGIAACGTLRPVNAFRAARVLLFWPTSGVAQGLRA